MNLKRNTANQKNRVTLLPEYNTLHYRKEDEKFSI